MNNQFHHISPNPSIDYSASSLPDREEMSYWNGLKVENYLNDRIARLKKWRSITTQVSSIALIVLCSAIGLALGAYSFPILVPATAYFILVGCTLGFITAIPAVSTFFFKGPTVFYFKMLMPPAVTVAATVIGVCTAIPAIVLISQRIALHILQKKISHLKELRKEVERMKGERLDGLSNLERKSLQNELLRLEKALSD